MKARIAILVLGLSVFGASSAFAGPVTFLFTSTGQGVSAGAVGDTFTFISTNGLAKIWASSYVCDAPTAQSVSTLTYCNGTPLYLTPTGLGLANEADKEIAFDGTTADYVVGLNLSDLVKLGATGVSMTFNTITGWEAWVALGYSSDPFCSDGSACPITLGADTKAWSEVDTASFELGSDDQYLILIASCGASQNPDGPCGSVVSPISLTTETPEPGTIALFVTGLLMLGFVARRRWAAGLASVRS
ncbi:MAG: PEP-CTERM sorting domain-containing protein [Candidatus Acidiferrales bacterium]